MTILNKKEFLRSFAVRPNGSLNFLLGAGSSVQANIPAAGTLIWQFKRKLYCEANIIREEKFKDLESERNRRIIQNHFELAGGYPPMDDPREYSFYFEKCYPNSIDRKAFIQRIVQGKRPSIGHKCLGVLFDSEKTSHIWTTNFDELIESGIKSVNNAKSFETISPENYKQIENLNRYPRVIKLHGDYRYDRLQNTSSELQGLERKLHAYFAKKHSEAGLIVIGYSGNDNSIIQAFQAALKSENPFPFGLVWCVRKGERPSNQLIQLIDDVNSRSNEKLSGFIEVESFDDFLFELYIANGVNNSEIEDIAKIRFETRKAFTSPQVGNNFTPIKLNGLKARSFPKTVFSFKIDVSGWKELRETIGDQPICGALSKGNALVFGSVESISKTFGAKIKSEIRTVDIEDTITYFQDSFFIGLIYDLIDYNLKRYYGLSRVPTHNIKKYYSTSHAIPKDDLKKYGVTESVVVYEAFELQIGFYNKELFMTILSSVHFEAHEHLSKLEKQSISNKIFSNRRNTDVNEKTKFWIGLLKNTNGLIKFEIDSFKLEFESNYSTIGIPVSKTFSLKGGFQNPEPKLDFHITDVNYRICHPLKGLKAFGPLDYSFENKQSTQQAVKLGILAPASGISRIIKHLNGLNEEIKPRSEEDYLIDYLPFASIYKRYLEVPQSIDNKFVELIDDNEAFKFSALEFYDYVKRKVDYFFTIRGEFDVLILFLPDSFKRFREVKDDTTYFDLHDSLKLYCAKKNLKIQFIEDKSINYFDQAKVRWWLSLGIYAKANGTPWRNQMIDDSTAFIGLDFAIQKTNSQTKYVLGSSQIFDSSGQGLRFLLQPIEQPVFYGKNPFMSKEDARRLILKLKEAYFRVDGNSKLDKIVIHKVLHFTRDEMQGIAEAVEGIENIELLQIQKYTNWRAIRGNNDGKEIKIHNYPIQRGTVIQLDDFSFLLWTHGSVIDKDVSGLSRNYYQSKRGIPAPLLVRRFRGKDPIETTVKEILSLTKMNWNGGELYKTLPVTLDFSKRLSRYAKQSESLQATPYDFRFFM